MTKEEAIAYFKYGITHDIFSEPVISYAKLAIEALQERPKGRWIELPCEIGDTIYFVDVEDQVIDEAKVSGFEICYDGLYINSDYEIGTLASACYLFYTLKDAEAALNCGADMRESEQE